MCAPEAILLEQVSKRFGNFRALDRVSLSLSAGRFALLAGANGAGKSTLLRLLAGLCRPTSGRIRIQGSDPGRTPAMRSAIGLLSHQTMLYEDLTARENLLLAARLHDLPEPEERLAGSLARVGLETRQHHRVRTFSRGMKQRLALARATLHEPAILLLDEPYTGLDQGGGEALTRHLTELSEQGCTGVLATHRLENAVSLIDHVILLQSGGVCFNSSWDTGDLADLQAAYAAHTEELR